MFSGGANGRLSGWIYFVWCSHSGLDLITFLRATDQDIAMAGMATGRHLPERVRL